jgi:CheY-like chemotaxis protein
MPHTLLLADDSVTIQRVIELTFTDENVRVIAVGDGRQAIDRIAADPPDIVLADVGMPGCDGFEVAAFVKGRADLAHIPVLLLTGAFEPVDEARVVAVRADGVLAKPFEPQELIARVNELLAVAPVARTMPAHASRPVVLAPVAEQSLDAFEPEIEPTPPAVPQEEKAAPPPPAPHISLDDYFDRLDAAFASLASAPHAEEGGGAAPLGEPDSDAAWRGRDAGFRWTSPPPAAMPTAAERVKPGGAGAAAVSRGALQPLSVADAFTALLAAEESGPLALPPSHADGPVALSGALPSVDELVDQVAERVIDHLTDQVVRDQVADRVSAIAERLVREEIERLRASVK